MGRHNLYMFRCEMRMTQEEMAEKIGCNRSTYSAIEKGTREGRMYFWRSLKSAFGLSEEKIWELMKVEKDEQTENDRSAC